MLQTSLQVAVVSSVRNLLSYLPLIHKTRNATIVKRKRFRSFLRRKEKRKRQEKCVVAQGVQGDSNIVSSEGEAEHPFD